MEPIAGEAQRYDRMTIVLHWLTALMVAGLWVGAKTTDWLPRGAMRADFRSLHIALGLALGALGAARFVWRLSWGRPLPPLDAGVFGAVAKATHRGLYGLLAAMVCVGVLLAWTKGDSVFNQFAVPPLDPDARVLAGQLRHIHSAIGWAIIGLAALHILAVLFHHYVLRDGVLGRMVLRGQAT